MVGSAMPTEWTELDYLEKDARHQRLKADDKGEGMMSRVKQLEEALARHHARVLNEPVPETLMDVITKFDASPPKLG